MTDIKAAARADAFQRRAEAFAAGQGQAAEILADFLAPHRGKVLSGYMPMRSEIDPLPAMAVHQGPVGVPVIVAKAAPLRFREWSPGCRMVEGTFKALVPEEGAWLEPEVVIVPMLAFDARGYRLGYGGGSTTGPWSCCARGGRCWRWDLRFRPRRWRRCRLTSSTSGWMRW